MPHEFLEALPVALLEVSILLGAAVLIGLVAQKIHIPVTVVLAVAGFLVVNSGLDLEVAHLVGGVGLKEMLVNLFLPVLIFEAALGLSTREFMRNIVSITALATIAVVISAALVGFGLHYALGIPLAVALLFGALISATDPVAVVAVFRELGVPKRLLTIVDGESLLNDGVAIVLYGILLAVATGESIGVAEGFVEFFVVAVGGIAVGAVIGVVAVTLMPLLSALPSAAFSIAVAYGSFVLAEHWHISGVMATMTAGIAMGAMLESRADSGARELLHELWESLGYVANALLFLFIGLALDADLFVEHWKAILIGLAAVVVSRPLAVVPLMSFLERAAHIPSVGRRNSAVLVWGGLRGGVALALALALPTDMAERDMVIAMTGGVVLATLLVNATTIGLLVHWLGLDAVRKTDEYLEALARLAGVEAARHRLSDLGLDDELVARHLDVAEADAKDQLARADLSHQQELDVLTLRGLHIERETYQGLGDSGLLPPIAIRTLLEEIEAEIEEVELGGLRVDAARRAHLPWYGRAHRWLLGKLPPPLGADLVEVGYVEVSARRLAARRAAEELETFKRLPEVDGARVDEARQLFLHWEQSASSTLETLHAESTLDRVTLHRRQAKALGCIAVADALGELVNAGVLSSAIAEEAMGRVSREIGEAGT